MIKLQAAMYKTQHQLLPILSGTATRAIRSSNLLFSHYGFPFSLIHPELWVGEDSEEDIIYLFIFLIFFSGQRGYYLSRKKNILKKKKKKKKKKWNLKKYWWLALLVLKISFFLKRPNCIKLGTRKL
jgi:Na+/H+ antiporter NhaD/arsenite permease-like protein